MTEIDKDFWEHRAGEMAIKVLIDLYNNYGVAAPIMGAIDNQIRIDNTKTTQAVRAILIEKVRQKGVKKNEEK